MAREVQTADPELRRKVLALLVVVTGLAVFAVLRLAAHLAALRELAKSDAAEAASGTLAVSRLFLVTIALIAAGLAAYLGRIAWRTLATDRYPPPGPVIGDTRVVRGPRARRYGWSLLALAAAILAAGLLVAYRADRHLQTLLRPTLEATDVSPSELRPE